MTNELTDIELCTSLDVPPDKIVDAAIAAVEENEDNAPRRRPARGVGLDGGGPMEMALITEKRWKPGRTITVTFLDGDPGVQAKVVDYAKQWEDHANLELDFVDNPNADLRISFRNSGSWSYLGTDNLVIDKPNATMNYGWLTPTSQDREYSRVVLHEFGHALGAIHEHQNPVAGIPWDEEEVYRYYQATNGWDRQRTYHNVLRRYEADKTNHSSYDPASIMQYSVPNALTVGDFEIGWNTVLSDTDKDFMAAMYPGKDPAEGVLEPGVPVDAEIGKPGEQDLYTFSLVTDAQAVIETTGHTDLVMSLYGPDSRVRLAGWDDDSGRHLNARISEYLTAGDYLVKLRHYRERGEGGYTVTLTV